MGTPKINFVLIFNKSLLLHLFAIAMPASEMRKTTTLFALLLYFSQLTAQNTIGLPLVRNYNREDYSAGRQTWAVSQDQAGRLYFGNNAGLLTYDGNRWELFPLPNKTSVRSVLIHQERIYTGGEGEIGYFQPNAQGLLSYHSLTPLFSAAHANFAAVWKIEAFNGGLFFFCRDVIFEYRNNSIKKYTAATKWRLLKKAGNRLFAQDNTKGILEFNGSEWKPLAPIISPDFLVSGIAVAGNDSLLVASERHGLYLLTGNKLTPFNNPANAIFKQHYIYTLTALNDSVFAAGTVSAGCVFFNKQGVIMQQVGRKEGLQDNSVLALQTDQDGNIWAGLNSGISCIAYNAAFKYIKPNRENDYPGHDCLIHNNRMYIATSDGVYLSGNLVHTHDLSFSKSDFTFIPSTRGQCWKFDLINNSLFLGHNKGGFLLENDRAIKLPYESGTWLYRPLPGFAPGNTLIAGTYSGLYQFSGSPMGNVVPVSGVSVSLRFLCVSPDGSLWASHPYLGIYHFTRSGPGAAWQPVHYTDKNGLPAATGNYVFALNDKIVFTTEKGVYEYDSRTDRFVPSPNLYKILGPNSIQYMKEDGNGNIWFCMGEKTGVVLDKGGASQRVVFFPELSGIILYGHENIYPYNTENIFIAASKGVIHFNLRAYQQSKVPLRTMLSAVRLSGSQPDSLLAGGYGYWPNTAGATALKLSSRNNSLHFYYSSPSYNPWRKIQFSYFLEGYDKGWSAASPKPEKEYTNLPPGKYRFRVKAIDNLAQESQEAEFAFLVQPPFYKTNLAYLCYIAVCAGIAWMVARRVKMKIYRQREKFEKEQERMKYIHQLEIDKNEKEIIKLQNEKLANEIIFKNKELASVSMHLVERTDALLKVKDELGRLSKRNDKDNDIKKVVNLLKDIERNNANWEQFASHFDDLNNDFLKKLSTVFPNLTPADLKLCAYLQLNLSTKEIAQLLNLSVRGVETSRYRLRKKMNLQNDQGLSEYLNSIYLHGEHTDGQHT